MFIPMLVHGLFNCSWQVLVSLLEELKFPDSSLTSSRIPPTFVAITGRPQLRASMTTFGYPSL